MNSPRRVHSAILISGAGALNGQVLIAGGIDDLGVVLDTAELFNPTGQTFTLTTGKMLSAHAGHAAAQLP
jgi:Kelch motif